MQWSAAPHAGFTTGTPWIGCAENYPESTPTRRWPISTRCFTPTASVITLRKQYPLLTHGDIRSGAGSPGAVVLSAQLERPAPAGGGNLSRASRWRRRKAWKLSAQWRPLMSNYSDSADQPQALTPVPFEAVWVAARRRPAGRGELRPQCPHQRHHPGGRFAPTAHRSCRSRPAPDAAADNPCRSG